MKILVYDIPAVHGGAATVLKECYAFACRRTDIEWVFVVSIPEIALQEHIKVYCVPPETRGRVRRLLFERSGLQRILKEEGCDVVLSLTNMLVPGKANNQIIYMHNALPFCDEKFSPRKERSLWMYKHVIGSLIRAHMKKCGGIVVQTCWVRDAVMRKTGVSVEKFVLCPPALQAEQFMQYQDSPRARRRFIYPAGTSVYKNHAVVLRAVKLLQQKGYTDFTVSFTIAPGVEQLGGISLEGLPIEKTGMLPYEQLVQRYTDSVLLFPSKIETFGLPMLEARRSNAFVIASDRPFSNEVLAGYPNGYFFPEDDAEKLTEYMQQIMDGTLPHCQPEPEQPICGGWDAVVTYMQSKCKDKEESYESKA